MNLTITLRHHAALHEIYHPGQRDFIKVGEPGDYGPIDPETGAAYKVLGYDETGTGKKIGYTKDWKPGSFYPPKVFIMLQGINSGEGIEPGEDVTFEDLEEVASAILGLNTDRLQRCLIPRGWDGEPTWHRAITPRVVDDSPRFWSMFVDRLKELFGEDNVVENGPKYLQVFQDG